jgi:heme exporter protein A
MPAGTIRVERILEMRHVSKYFGDFLALRDVTFRLAGGESVLIYGPNGAGKTTLLRMLASLTQPSEGEIWLDGVRVSRKAVDYKKRIGFVSHATLLYDDLTVRENLTLTGKLFSIRGVDARIDYLLDLFDLAERGRDFVRTLSRGLQQRVTLARAMLHEPDFLLLDEPFTGLDASSVTGLEAVLRNVVEQGRAVIFSTHGFAQGLSVAGRLIRLEKGRVSYDGPASEPSWSLLRVRPEESAEYEKRA